MKYITACGFLLLLCSCASRQITTTWKEEHISSGKYHRILVVAILPETDSMLREKMETEFVHSLESWGYQAVTAISEFGPRGVAGSGEENTYLKLCDKGIDAVITLALLPRTKETWYPPGSAYTNPNNYYYKRIWDYRKVQADTAGIDKEKDEYFWESILFDLATLEAVCTVRTQSFTKEGQPKVTEGLARQVTKKMLKEEVLRKQPVTLKPF